MINAVATNGDASMSWRMTVTPGKTSAIGACLLNATAVDTDSLAELSGRAEG